MKSLQDQLLKAWLTDKQSVRKLNKQQQKQAKKPKSERQTASDSAKQAEQARAAKAERDRELNKQRHQANEQKAIQAQIRQLIQSSKLERPANTAADQEPLTYHFNYAGKIKKLYVTDEQQAQLSKQQIAIVALSDEQFELVPKVVASKIAQRDASAVVALGSAEEPVDEEDPYADYAIPDDLMW
ncbi:MAG: DUF2058 domain-containing protein [Pseudomonadota bacterium]